MLGMIDDSQIPFHTHDCGRLHGYTKAGCSDGKVAWVLLIQILTANRPNARRKQETPFAVVSQTDEPREINSNLNSAYKLSTRNRRAGRPMLPWLSNLFFSTWLCTTTQ